MSKTVDTPAVMPAPSGARTTAGAAGTEARRRQGGCLEDCCRWGCHQSRVGCGCVGWAAAGLRRHPSQKTSARGRAQASWPWACRRACRSALRTSRWTAGAVGSGVRSPRLGSPCGGSVRQAQHAAPHCSCRAAASSCSAADIHVEALSQARGLCRRMPAAVLRRGDAAALPTSLILSCRPCPVLMSIRE